MSVDARIGRSFQIGGKSFDQNSTATAGTAVVKEVSIPAAHVAALTTRTDNDTGDVTITGTNLISTGNRVDVYWDGGSRRGMTAGTVAGQSVPIDGGAGDNLPAQATALQVAVSNEYELVIDGDDMVAFALWGQAQGLFTFADSGDVEIWAVELEAGVVYLWDDNNSVTNPTAGGAIAKVFLSHKDTTGPKTMRVGFLLNI